MMLCACGQYAVCGAWCAVLRCARCSY
jgi:hypothetical protein